MSDNASENVSDDAMYQLRLELQRRMTYVSAADLLRVMGYKKLGDATFERLSRVLADPELGLGGGDFDFRFGSQAFLYRLCDALGLPEERYRPIIEARRQWLSDEIHAFKPYVFIDTGFRRQDRPGTAVFVLALCESRRRLTFPKGFWRKSRATQIKLARRRIREFMKSTGGHIEPWGKARRFLFFHAPQAAIVVSPDGRVLGEWEGGVPNRAILSVGQREIPEGLLSRAGGNDSTQ